VILLESGIAHPDARTVKPRLRREIQRGGRVEGRGGCYGSAVRFVEGFRMREWRLALGASVAI